MGIYPYNRLLKIDYLGLDDIFLIFNHKYSIQMGETMENTKPIAAAISAVMNYIHSEEEAICMQAMAAPSVAPVFQAVAPTRTEPFRKAGYRSIGPQA